MGCTSSKSTRVGDTKKKTTEGFKFEKQDECKKCFDAYDVDKSGTLDVNEITTQLGVKPEDAKYILRQIDTDGGSGIDYAEFERFFAMTDKDTPQDYKLKLFFKGMDFDGSGTVNAEEMANYLAGLCNGATPEQFKEFCEEACKADKKGELTAENFESLKDHFDAIIEQLDNIGELLRKPLQEEGNADEANPEDDDQE